MGLSRNKVAVSEGAAGSPPFYGDNVVGYTSPAAKMRTFFGRCSILRDLQKREPEIWGCSSAGRAPALQAGGHGFESHHLHHTGERKRKLVPYRLIAQVVRARA